MYYFVPDPFGLRERHEKWKQEHPVVPEVPQPGPHIDAEDLGFAPPVRSAAELAGEEAPALNLESGLPSGDAEGTPVVVSRLPAPPEDPHGADALPDVTLDEMDRQGRAAAAAYQQPGVSPFYGEAMAGAHGAGADAEARGWDYAEASVPQTYSYQVPNKMHGPTMEHGAAHRSANEQILQATEDQGASAYDSAYRELAFLKKQEETINSAMERRMQLEQEAEQKIQDQFVARQSAQEAVMKAQKAYESAPKEDPGRFWASRSGFAKFALVLSAIGKGWLQGQGMNIDPMGAIKDAIKMDIDAQRSDRAQLAENLTAAERANESSRNLWGDLRTLVDDKNARAEVQFNAQMRMAAGELMRMKQQAHLGQLGSEIDKILGQAEKEIADSELRLDAMAVANPAMFTKVGKRKTTQVVDPQGRVRTVTPEFAAKQANREMDTATHFRKQPVEIATKAAGQDTDARVKAWTVAAEAKAKAQAGPTTEDRRLHSNNLWRYAENTESAAKELDMLQSWADKYSNDVPGFVAGVGWMRPKGNEIQPLWGQEEEAAYQELHRAVMVRLRRETGAVIGKGEAQRDSPLNEPSDAGGTARVGSTEEALAKQADAILSFHATEGTLMDEVNRRIAEAKGTIDYYERVLADSERTDFAKGDVGSIRHRPSGSGDYTVEKD